MWWSECMPNRDELHLLWCQNWDVNKMFASEFCNLHDMEPASIKGFFVFGNIADKTPKWRERVDLLFFSCQELDAALEASIHQQLANRSPTARHDFNKGTVNCTYISGDKRAIRFPEKARQCNSLSGWYYTISVDLADQFAFGLLLFVKKTYNMIA